MRRLVTAIDPEDRTLEINKKPLQKEEFAKGTAQLRD